MSDPSREEWLEQHRMPDGRVISPEARRHREQLAERLGLEAEEADDGQGDAPEPEPVVEPVEVPEPDDEPTPPAPEAAPALGKREAVCVRCGAVHERRGYQPLFDETGTTWYSCREGCEPPEAADWPGTVINPDDARGSVFDAGLLAPEDHLGPATAE